MMALEALRSVEVEVPGKIMLAGEYSVLKGGSSLSVAVDAFLTLTLSDSEKPGVWVESNIWPSARLLGEADPSEPLIDSLSSLAAPSAHVRVRSELDVAFGLGSSSAVRFAAQLVTEAFQSRSKSLPIEKQWDAARAAWQRQKASQGFASGYDFVTQLQGGLVALRPDYERWPGLVEAYDPQWLSEFIHPYVGGQGAPTGSVGGQVREFLSVNELWTELSSKSETLIAAMLSQDPEGVIEANQAHQALFQDAPFYPRKLRNLLASLSHFGRSWSFKTTGAGGEDAILLLGPRSELHEPDLLLRREGWRPLPHAFTRRGSRISWKDLGQ